MPRSFVAKLLFLVPSQLKRAPLMGFLPRIWARARSDSHISTILVRKGAYNYPRLRKFLVEPDAFVGLLPICALTSEFDATALDAYAIIARRSLVGPIQPFNQWYLKGLGLRCGEVNLRYKKRKRFCVQSDRS